MSQIDDLERRIAALERRTAVQSARDVPNYSLAYKVISVQNTEPYAAVLKRVYNDSVLGPELIEGVLPLDSSYTALAARGEYVILVHLADGTKRYFKGGGGASILLRAQAAMAADNTDYTALPITALNTGDADYALQVKRPPGIYIEYGEIGFLGMDSVGANIFIPANARLEYHNDLRLPVAASSQVAAGLIWLRRDV